MNQSVPRSIEESPRATGRVDNKYYDKELARLEVELVKQQEWVRARGLRVVVLFEGRDAAGKGGAIQRITESLSPRFARVVALGTPTEREKTQWYFQRYVAQLLAAGEMILFDRSWYNRAGVEHVMVFCTDDEYREFLRSCPEFERMLVRAASASSSTGSPSPTPSRSGDFRSGSLIRPSVGSSPMDLESRAKWVEYSKAKDMFAATDIPEAPWYVVEADVKKRVRLNVMHHLLSLVPYEDLTPQPLALAPRPKQQEDGYVRPPKSTQHVVPDVVPVFGR